MRRRASVARARTIGALGLVLTASGCGASPTNVRCHNGGECRNLDEKYRYCLQSHCVECVGDAACREGFRCKSGACVFDSD